MTVEDFSQEHCSVQRIDGAADLLHGTVANVARGHLAASLVVVAGGRLRVVRPDGQAVLDAPLVDVRVGPRRAVTPTAVSVDAAGHRWMVDFAYVHKAQRRSTGGIGPTLASMAAVGNLRSVRVGRRLRDQFVGVLLAHGGLERAG